VGLDLRLFFPLSPLTAGLGMIRATFQGIAHAPAGVMHALRRWVGLRVDGRYLLRSSTRARAPASTPGDAALDK
jgi:hypothetical protein